MSAAQAHGVESDMVATECQVCGAFHEGWRLCCERCGLMFHDCCDSVAKVCAACAGVSRQKCEACGVEAWDRLCPSCDRPDEKYELDRERKAFPEPAGEAWR